MKVLYALIITLFSSSLFAQDVSLLSQTDFASSRKTKSKTFDFVPKTDTVGLIAVATFRATTDGQKSTITGSFYKIEKDAKKLGANCFCLVSDKMEYLDNKTFIIETYFAEDSVLQEKRTTLPTNKVFIFCGENANGEVSSLKVNGKKSKFSSGTYLVYNLEEGQKLKLSKGGLMGSSVSLNYKENKPAVFATVGGFGVNGVTPSPTGMGMGISFSTGRISPMDSNLGFLLTELLKQVE